MIKQDYYLHALGIQPWRLRLPNATLHKIDISPTFEINKNNLLFIIESRSTAEDSTQKSTTLLHAMLTSIGLDMTSVCTTTQDPHADITKHIASTQPKLIIALGQKTSSHLLNTDVALSQLRGKLHQYQHIPCIVTYHPHDLLKSPSDKKYAFDDLQSIHAFLLTGDIHHGLISSHSNQTL